MKIELIGSCTSQGSAGIRSQSRLPGQSFTWRFALLAALVTTAAPVVAQDSRSSSAPDDSLRARRAIERAVSIARTAGTAVRVAQSNLELARARAAAAGAQAPASLGGGLSEAPNGNIDQGNVRLELTREVFTGNRRRAARAVADVDVSSASLELSLINRRLEAAVIRDLLRAAASRTIATRLASEDLLLAGAEDGVRSRFAAGQARYVDVLRVRTERLRVQSERSQNLASERIAFAELLQHIPRDSGGVAAALIDTIVASALGESWQGVLGAAPSIDSLIAWSGVQRRAQLAAQRALANRDLLLMEQKPRTELYGGLQRIGQANNGPAMGPTFGFSVSLPFTARDDNTRLLGAAAQSIVAVRVQSEASTLSLRAHLAAALERYQSARTRIQVFDAALLRGAREERESALAAYRTGSLSLLELIDFERALSRAEIERIRALIDAADALADLFGDDEASSIADTFNDTSRLP